MEDDDCLGCRLVSGGGLIFAASYIHCQAANKSRGSRIAMYGVASVFGALGLARLWNFNPFREKTTTNNKKTQ